MYGFPQMQPVPQMNSPMSEDLSRSVKDMLQTHQVPQEFVTEPIIEEKVIEVFVPVYEKEIVEIPQVCSIKMIAWLKFRNRFNMLTKSLRSRKFKSRRR